MVSFSSSFNFRNDNRHLVFVEIFSFIPTAPSLMGHVRVSRDKESVIQVMQDGDFYRFFFSNYHRRQFFFWPSYLSSAKCLHTRHKDSFFSETSRLRFLKAELQSVLLFLADVVLFNYFEIYNSAISEVRKISIVIYVWLEMLINHTFENGLF